MDPKLEIQGQLVIVVNHRPWYGRSLDGTLGKISRASNWLTRMGDQSHTYVDLFRRHRRTQRPLGLREEFMRTENLRPIDESELDAAQKELVAHFGLVKLAQLAHRAKLRADNLAWEQRMLAVGGWAVPSTADTALSAEQLGRITDAAGFAIAELESLLTTKPPEGTEAGRVRELFDQFRADLVEALVAVTVRVSAERLARKLQRAANK